MPRIDPLKLLTCLKVLLAPNGGIRSANEVKRLAELMAKYSKKLVSKCIYIQILKSTDTELLGKFMGVGGWSLTHMWLNDGIKAANWPLVQEILELLLLCPVDVQRLRSNTAPKLVKGLCKDGGNEGVRILATKLVEQWLKVVKGETMAVSEQQAPNSHQLPAVNGVIASSSVTIAAATKVSPDCAQQAAVNDIQTALISPTKPNADESLVYKIKLMKDGKPVLAKVVSNDAEASGADGESGSRKEGESISETDASNTGASARISNDADDKLPDRENDSKKRSESEEKELSKEKDSDKEKSRSSKDRDRHRSSSSSSSSRHKSSSSKSSSSKSSSSGSSRSKSSSHNSSSSSSSSKHKDKESSDRDKHRSSSKSSPSSSSSSKDKDKSRSSKDKEREKSRSSSEKDKDKSRSDKDKDRSEKDKDRDSEKDEQCSSPSIDKLGKIPKKSSEDSEEPLVTSITIPSKKASMSIEIRRGDVNRPKTVKTFKSQFRSHGLYEEAPPPPSRKGLRKPVSTAPTPGIAIPSNIAQKRSSPPPMPLSPVASATVKELLPPAEKKLKIDLTTAPATEKPGAVKFIAPKPKRIVYRMFFVCLIVAANKRTGSNIAWFCDD